MRTYEFIFWEPCVSPHKVDFVNALSASPNVDAMKYVAHALTSPGRSAQGWPDVSSQLADLVIAPDRAEIETIIGDAPSNTVHVFSGIRHFSVLERALETVMRLDKPFGLYHEPRVIEGVSGKVRLLQSLLSEREVRRKARFVLAIGRNGSKWFTGVGYPKERVFPYAYFIDQPTEHAAEPSFSHLTVAYVGRLVEEKGIQLFLKLAEQYASPECCFLIAGEGPYKDQVRALSEKVSNISFMGPLPMKKAQALLHTADLVVVPSQSTNDGWGVVVTEALLAGSYVLTNNRVGASLALTSPMLGLSAPTCDESALRQLFLRVRDNKGLFSKQARQQRREWASQNLTTTAGVDYFNKILAYCFEDGALPGAWPPALENDQAREIGAMP